jgi:putative membrane protein
MANSGFSAADVEAVRRAVAVAEATSAGDIVPYVVAASDPYPGALWKGATLGALLASLLAWAVEQWLGLWAASAFVWTVLPPAAGAALGLLAVHFVPALRRALTGQPAMELRTHRRAATAFVEEEVFKTAGRTGVLIFLSLFERRVVVLADSGIHARVAETEWDALAARIVTGIREGTPGAALVAAIDDCAALLVRHGLRRPPGEASQLAPDLRQGTP